VRVVRAADSVGVALGCAAELVHWTASIIVCLLPSTMTVVLGAVALERGEVADWPPLLEQAERLTPITTTLSPPTARTSRRPIRWRLFGLVIAVPSLGRHEDYRACSLPEHLASRFTARLPNGSWFATDLRKWAAQRLTANALR